MNEKMIVADLCKCYAGTAMETVGRIQEFASREGVPTERISVIARHDQTELIVPLGWAENRCNRWESVSTVSRVLDGIAKGPSGKTVLLSYDRSVLNLAVRPWGSLVVEPLPFSELRARAIHTPRLIPWRFEHVISLDEALSAMLRVLERKNSFSQASACHSASLRPAMAMIDPRFEGGAQATNTSGMISALVRIAESKQLVGVDWAVPINPLIWSLARQAPAPAASGPSSVADSVNAVPVSQVLVPESTNDKGEVDPLMQHRSRRLEALLKGEGMGPFTVGRLAMVKALPSKLDPENGSTLDALISNVEKEARSLLAADGFDPTKQPWKKIANLMAKLLTASGAVLDADKKPIPPGWSSRLTKVYHLAENWAAMIDAEIILALITVADDVSEDDVTDLAGLLYHSRDDESREKVFKAVAHLLVVSKAAKEDVRNGHRYLAPADGRISSGGRSAFAETAPRIPPLAIAK